MSEPVAIATYLGDRPLPYCKGCGHGLVARRLNEALLRLRIDPKDVVLTSDIGCVGLVDPLFPEVHTVHTIHGRSTAVATGAVLADRLLGDGRMKNLVMIGDGGATIGLLHLTQAALMNVDVTVLLHNNFLYGMTGGQHSALTPEGFHTSTTPRGNWVPALDMELLLAGCQGGFYARQVATDHDLAEVIAEAIRHPGFALVEILELCTGFGVPLNELDGKTLRRLAEAEGRQWGIRTRRADRRPYHETYREQVSAVAPPPIDAPPTTATPPPGAFGHRLARPMGVLVAGSAGERVQSAAAILGQAAVLADLHCTQKNDYPTTVGTGFSLSEVMLSPDRILYTGLERPDAILVTSGDGLRELTAQGALRRLAADGVVVADTSVADALPAERTVVRPFRERLTASHAALGAVAVLVRRTGILDRAALAEAARVILGRQADGALRAIESAWALAD